MAGYIGHSMSVNAARAYSAGLKPLSQLRASDFQAAEWPESVVFAKWLADEGHWDYSEWHHSSKHFNKVRFYDPEALVAWWKELDDEDRKSLRSEFARRKTTAPEPEPEAVRVQGTYTEWSGSRNYPKRREVPFTGTKRGDWIELDGGGRKKTTGNHIKWRVV